MKKNGYTLVELLVLVVAMGVAAFFTIRNVSYALVDNTNELYNESIYSILEAAKTYGNDNLEALKESSMVITVQDLIDKSYLGSDENGNFKDIRTEGATLNDLKIAISYDEENNSIKAKLAN